MLDLEVEPERSLGNEQWKFVLGMPFYKAVHILRKNDVTIKGVHICYNDENPLASDLVIDLTQDGIRLLFDSRLQLLKIIEVYNLNKVKLKYCGVVFNSSTVRPTMQQIDESFGVTHPGVYQVETQSFVLSFRGLSFCFKCESRYIQGWGTQQFSQGTSAAWSHMQVSRLLIYAGNNLEQTVAPPIPLCSFRGGQFMERADVLCESGFCTAIRFLLITENHISTKLSDTKIVTKETTVHFGDTCQDVMSALGCPNKIYYKDEDKMKIHAASSSKATDHQRKSEYFFNYFTLGVDIMFDSRTHQVNKFVLHTNFPGHYDFNMFCRCNFYIPISILSPEQTDKKSSSDTMYDNDIKVLYDTKWHSVQDRLISHGKKPVVLNRVSTINTTNPFGCTYCHVVRNMIFEVMQNDHISSVTIYRVIKHRSSGMPRSSYSRRND